MWGQRGKKYLKINLTIAGNVKRISGNGLPWRILERKAVGT